VPGREQLASVYVSCDSWNGAALEADLILPMSSRLSSSIGFAAYRNAYADATSNNQIIGALSFQWQPSSSLELEPFWQRTETFDDRIGPVYVSAKVGPPRLPRQFNAGPRWAKHVGYGLLYGIKGTWRVGPDTRVQAGLFRSSTHDSINSSNIFTNLTRDGTGDQIIEIDPPSFFGATSGETRLDQSFQDGPRSHRIYLSLRGRKRSRLYGGSFEYDLGKRSIYDRNLTRQSAFVFSEQSRDQVSQWTAGLGYGIILKHIGELSVGLQKTDYEKTVLLPGLSPSKTSSRPWLFNVTAAIYVRHNLSIYAGAARGLEESGIAPLGAVNRNQPLPAIRTSQKDGGLRWTFGPKAQLSVGAFELLKPYSQLNGANFFTVLGSVRSRGIEASLKAEPVPGLSLLVGGVLLDPQVTGEGVTLGLLGKRPVGIARQTFKLNANWQPPDLTTVSFDFGVRHLGKRWATRDNSVQLPERTFVDFGARYRVNLATNPVTLRLTVTNVFNIYSVDVSSSGIFYVGDGRQVSVSVAADF